MRLHCYQASRRPSMTTDRPPLLMAHIDLGIGPNISTCVRGVGAMCAYKKNISNYECNR